MRIGVAGVIAVLLSAREFNLVDDDFKAVAFFAVFIFVFGRLEPPFDENARAFSEILAQKFSGFIPRKQIDKVNGVFVFAVRTIDGDRGASIRLAALRVTNFNVASEIATQKYFVHDFYSLIIINLVTALTTIDAGTNIADECQLSLACFFNS